MASFALGAGRISRERYWGLVAEGVIGADDRVELLDGVIVAMSPQHPPHTFVITRLNRWLQATVGEGATVRVQMPLDVSDFSTPEPDIAVVLGRPADHLEAHPTSALLVIEVASDSLIQDRLSTGPIYAAAGIAEYWLVNLRERCIEVYRQPSTAERRYAETRIVHSGEILSPTAWPTATIAAEELLPPPATPHPS